MVGAQPAAAQSVGGLPDASPTCVDDTCAAGTDPAGGNIIVPNLGRFVNVTRGFDSLGDTGITDIINISVFSLVNSPQTNLIVDVFDGDNSVFNVNGANANPTEMWDLAPAGADTTSSILFPDPCRIGNTDPATMIPIAPTPSADNQWTNVVDIPQVGAALNNVDCSVPALPYSDGSGVQGPGDAYIYHFVTEWNAPVFANEQNNFKVRVTNGEAFILQASTVGFMAFGQNPVTFPNYHEQTFYDGTWEWNAVLLAPPGQAEPCVLEIWDGDLDFVGDTDDPNTVGLPSFPASPSTCAEGVNDFGNSTCVDLAGCDSTAGNECNTGIDDSANPAQAIAPSVQYTVIGPAGSYNVTNTDPSGNREWELFQIGSNSPFCLSNPATDYTATADFMAPVLIPGRHRIIFQGMDQLNTGFLNVNAEIFTPIDEECQDCDGKVTELTLQYEGPDNADIIVYQSKLKHFLQGKTGKSGGKGAPTSPIFDDERDSGEQFTVIGQNNKGTLGTDIIVCIDDDTCVDGIEIHTSCSQPIGPGTVFAMGDFTLTVIKSYSLNGGLICPIEPI